jgi:hypothetical protein
LNRKLHSRQLFGSHGCPVEALACMCAYIMPLMGVHCCYRCCFLHYVQTLKAHSDRYTYFWNEVHKELRAAGHPSNWVGAYAYASYTDPPVRQRFDPESKVLVLSVGAVRFFRQNSRSRMPLSFTPLPRLKCCHACDLCHSSRVVTLLADHTVNCVPTLKGLARCLITATPQHSLEQVGHVLSSFADVNTVRFGGRWEEKNAY